MTTRPGYARGTVVLVDLEPVRGAEQGRERPCIVVSDLEAVRQSRARPLYTIVPLTRSQTLVGPLAPRLSARDGGIPMDSVALCLHVRSIAPERVVGRVRGSLTREELGQIENGLSVLLGFERGSVLETDI